MLRSETESRDDTEGPTETNLPQTTMRPVDTRFRALVGDRAWLELPEPVRRRFSKAIGPTDVISYEGEVVLTELSLAGLVLANIARLIGSPLPLDPGATGPSRVTVTEASAAAGQSWTRYYTCRSGPPQVIESMKCFRGPTGLEEHVGAGIGMALAVGVEHCALVFRSTQYFCGAGPFRLRLPRWLSPGNMEIVHRQEPDNRFSFRLTLTHRWFGRLLHQLAFYRDT